MKKSLLAFVLAFSLVLSVAVPAFAATPSDVVGKTSQSAVEELIALGVINGYEDGTFKPENDITRAELAKLIVVATGNESAAKLMAGVPSTFKDVKTTHWANGYVNAAAAKGLIQGYEGQFRPEDKIKFEEVVAMLVRALGYKDSQLSGAWPYNYLLAAQDIKPASLYNGLDVTPGVNANRGIVAQLVSNTINSQQVTYSGTNGDVLVYGDKLVTKIGNASAGVLTDSKLDSNKKVSVNNSVYTTADNFVVTGGKKLAELAGREVTVITVNGKVAAISDKQAADKTVTGKAKAAITGIQGKEIELKDVTTKYTVAADALVFKNGVKVTTAADVAAGASLTLYLNDAGQARAVIITEYNPTDAVFAKYVAKTDYASANISTNSGTFNVDDNTVVTLNGASANVTDLAADDVLNIVATGTSTTKYAVTIEATRSSVQGAVTSIATSGATKTYTINGTGYQAVSGLVGGPIEVSTTERIFVLNADNKIVKVKSVAGATATSKYGVVLEVKKNVAMLDGVQVVTKDKYEFFNINSGKKEELYVDPAGSNVAGTKKYLQAFKFNAEGKATGLDTTLPTAELATTKAVNAVSATSVEVDGVIYNVNSNTAVVNVTDLTNIKTATIAEVAKGQEVVVVSSGINATVIAIVDSGVAGASNDITGLFVSATQTVTATGSTYSIKLNVAGEEKSFDVKESAFLNASGVVAKDLVTLNTSFTTLTKQSTPVAITADKVDTESATFEIGGANYVLTANSTVFVISKDKSSVAVGDINAIDAASRATFGTGNDYVAYVTTTGKTVGNGFNEVSTIVIQNLK